MPSSVVDDLPIPGSLLLVDVDGDVRGQHASGSSESDILLSPVPSNDVNDPLRWTWKRKQVQVAMLIIYVLCTGIASASLYSVLTPISENTGIPLSTLNEGTGYMFLLLGWGGLITQPLAMTFGKRPVYLATMVGHLGTVIWMGYINNRSEWLANKVLQGFFAAPIEMLVEVSFADIFYAHERGFYMGLYGCCLFSSNFIAPIWAGFVNDRYGYKAVFWVSAAVLGFGMIACFLFLEETNYNRGTSELEEKHDTSDLASHYDQEQSVASSQDKEKEARVAITVNSPTQLVGTPYTWFQRLALYRHRYATNKALFTMMYRPVLLLRFPVVFWSGFLYGSGLVWFNVLNATSSLIFTTTYNFSPSSVGLTYFGNLIGAILAAVWSGYIADKISLHFARRKNGVREPEDRLWLLTLNAILLPTGLILWGVGAAKHIHWIGLVIGAMMVAFTSATSGSFGINYALDSYKDLSGDVMVTVMLVRNTLSFAIGYGITPWVTNVGYQNTFITAAMVGMAIYSSFLIVVKFGKSWRKASRKTYWHYVETNVMPAH